MSTQCFDFSQAIPEIQFDNGTRLAFTNLEGRASQHLETVSVKDTHAEASAYLA